MSPYYGYYDQPMAGAAGAIVGGAAGFLMVFVLLIYFLLLAFSIVSYILQSLSFYTIAKRRGLNNPWLSWLPLGNLWIMGSISDQYQYMVKGRITGRRKTLLGLTLGMILVWIPVVVGIVLAAMSKSETDAMVGASVALMLLAYLAMIVLVIIAIIFQYIALHDLYASCDPGNATVFLVVSILFTVAMPFFLFACRKKDLGFAGVQARYNQPAPEPVQNAYREPLE